MSPHLVYEPSWDMELMLAQALASSRNSLRRLRAAKRTAAKVGARARTILQHRRAHTHRTRNMSLCTRVTSMAAALRRAATHQFVRRTRTCAINALFVRVCARPTSATLSRRKKGEKGKRNWTIANTGAPPPPNQSTAVSDLPDTPFGGDGRVAAPVGEQPARVSLPVGKYARPYPHRHLYFL